MEVKKWQEAKRWLTRPKAKPMPITKYIDTMNRLYSNYDESEDPRYVPPEEMIDIKKELQVSPMVKKPKKEIIKKVVEKPKPTYLNGNVIDITPLLDDEWWSIFGEDPPKEESRLLLVPKSKAEGIRSILNLHKKFVG
jgi:hypothetical protein